MTKSTGQRHNKKRGNVYQIPNATCKTHSVTVSFVDGKETIQIYCGSFHSSREAKAAASAVKQFRERLRDASYLPRQKTGRPRKTAINRLSVK